MTSFCVTSCLILQSGVAAAAVAYLLVQKALRCGLEFAHVLCPVRASVHFQRCLRALLLKLARACCNIHILLFHIVGD